MRPLIVLLVIMLLTACGGGGDSVQIENAVSATLTAVAISENTTTTPTATPEENEETGTPEAIAWDALADYQEIGVPLPKSDRLFGGGIYVPVEAYQDIQTATFGDDVALGVEAYFPNQYEGEDALRLADGTNVERVDFDVSGPDGLSVYSYSDDSPPYCLFGDSRGTCKPYTFSDNNCVWANSDTSLQSGFQNLAVTLVGDDGQSESWIATLEIQDNQCAGNVGSVTNNRLEVFGCCNNEGQRNDDVLSTDLVFFTTGYLAIEIELTDACSDARFYISVDGSEEAVSDFIGSESGVDRTGTIELGRYVEGEHTIRISPEGREGGCNSGTLNNWLGWATVYFSE